MGGEEAGGTAMEKFFFTTWDSSRTLFDGMENPAQRLVLVMAACTHMVLAQIPTTHHISYHYSIILWQLKYIGRGT